MSTTVSNMNVTFRRMMTARQRYKWTSMSRDSHPSRWAPQWHNIWLTCHFNQKEASMDYEMTIYFQQKWTDERLAWGMVKQQRDSTGSNNMTSSSYRRRANMNQIESRLIKRMWRPDVYFDFEKHSTRDNLFDGNMLLEISPQVKTTPHQSTLMI